MKYVLLLACVFGLSGCMLTAPVTDLFEPTMTKAEIDSLGFSQRDYKEPGNFQPK